MTETPDELFDAHLDDALLVAPVPVPAPAQLKEQVQNCGGRTTN